MSYTALYRKYRPQGFMDVKGQEGVVTTLKNQIMSGRTSHAYLFCGTRGTGKTTIAKILAKAVNCENPKDGNPCEECAMCKSISDGSSMNVMEIDAASNNGVDNIREIREEVLYSPPEGKKKVYIIDEVHMLSPGAFNALLKTLEEPPSYVMFILATTEAHKIPVTILSRCQRYEFKRINIDTIVERLNELVKAENLDAEEKAIRYIAKAADGGMRDALSLLDQCISYYYGETLTYDKVLDVLGSVDTEVFSELFRSVHTNDVPEALKILEESIYKGRDLYQFSGEFAWYLRNLLLVKTSDTDISEVLDVSSENIERLREEAKYTDQTTIMRYIRVFSELSNNLRYAVNKRILIEMAIIRLCKPAMEDDYDSLIERIRILEDKLENGNFVVSSENEASNEEAVKPAVSKAELPKALSEDIKKAVDMWPAIVKKIGSGGGMAARFLRTAKKTALENDKLIIVLEKKIAADTINEDSKALSVISEAIDEAVGAHVEFEIQGLESNERFEYKFTEIKGIDFEITEE